MTKVEQHIIKQDLDKFYNLCHLSKNLYNAALYNIRNYYFENKKYKSYVELAKEFASSKNPDYIALPAKVAQQTLKLVDQNFKSFFKSLKSKKVKKARIPKYLDKAGVYPLIYTNQAISFKKSGYIKLSKTDIEIFISDRIDKKDIQQVRLIPKINHFVIEIVYRINDVDLKEDNGRYASIDLGVNNLATIGSNAMRGSIINDKPLKSINQYYNKKRGYLNSKLRGNRKTSKNIQKLTNKRNRKIKDYMHKASRKVVNHLVSNSINSLIIGYNSEWKQETSIGKKNNQNFVFIPHLTFVNMLRYKCEELGINVIVQEESYTSKCSFLDNEPVKKHNTYLGKRIKRGLFKAKNRIINADLNGALNILRKAIPNAFRNGIEGIVVSPSYL